jgi:hypothetical protein
MVNGWCAHYWLHFEFKLEGKQMKWREKESTTRFLLTKNHLQNNNNNNNNIFSLITNLDKKLTGFQHDIQITNPYAYKAIFTPIKKKNLLITCLIELSNKLIDTKQILEKWKKSKYLIPCVLCVSENPIFFNNQTRGYWKKSIINNHK